MGKGIQFGLILKKKELKLTIGNSNSYIPPEDLPKLFDMFYTKNKGSIFRDIIESNLRYDKITCKSSYSGLPF